MGQKPLTQDKAYSPYKQKSALQDTLPFPNSNFCWIMLPAKVLTDNKAVTKFIQTKITPVSLQKAKDFVLHFCFRLSHIPGITNTSAVYLSLIENGSNEKIHLVIRENNHIQTVEVNQQSTGVAFWHLEPDSFYLEEQVWLFKSLCHEKTNFDSQNEFRIDATAMKQFHQMTTGTYNFKCAQYKVEIEENIDSVPAYSDNRA